MGRAESFPPKKKTLLMKKMMGYNVCLGLYTAQNNTNYQNEQKQLTIIGTKWEEIKRGTKVKRRRKGEQWQGQGDFAG